MTAHLAIQLTKIVGYTFKFWFLVCVMQLQQKRTIIKISDDSMHILHSSKILTCNDKFSTTLSKVRGYILQNQNSTTV